LYVLALFFVAARIVFDEFLKRVSTHCKSRWWDNKNGTTKRFLFSAIEEINFKAKRPMGRKTQINQMLS